MIRLNWFASGTRPIVRLQYGSEVDGLGTSPESDTDPVEIDPATRLHDRSVPKIQSSVYWPAPIDHRLNQLVDLARDSGEKLSKADVLGALVSQATTDGEMLGALVRGYRRSTVGEVVLRAESEGVIVLDERRPGVRRRPG